MQEARIHVNLEFYEDPGKLKKNHEILISDYLQNMWLVTFKNKADLSSIKPNLSTLIID